MLGKPVTAPVSIAKLLTLDKHHLFLTFEQPSAEVTPWLIDQLKVRTHIPADEFRAIVSKNHKDGAAWCKTNRLGWERELKPVEPSKAKVIQLNIL